MATTHQKKHFNEEATLDKVEKNIDHTMKKIMNTWIFAKILNHKIVKDILSSHVVNDVNSKLESYLKTIFIVVGRISLITWIIGIFSFLISLSGLGFMFSLWFGLGIRVLIYVILAIAFSLLSIFIWFGMIRFKKRVISLAMLWCAVSVLSLLISFIPVGLYSYRSYGSFWASLFNLLITLVLFVLLLKNQHMFKN
jgi:uncharacterized RDD family membrane protein YckC